MKADVLLLIDGENFIHKVRDVLKTSNTTAQKVNLSRININWLLDKALGDLTITRKVFYAAKLHFHKETEEKSTALILHQRYLKTQLEKQGFEFVIGGNVRAQKVGDKIIFREKGVDVKIAVDMVSLSADKKAKTIILCSSDSDLQPAVQETIRRGVEIIYLGFERQPNKGLTYTTNRTILLRDAEILEACGLK